MLFVSSLILKMDFVALLSVLAIAATQAAARPTDTEGLTKDGSGENSNVKEFKFTLPTSLQHNFKMVVSGTLDRSHENFTVQFPPKDGQNTESCTLNFNYKNNNYIEVTPEAEGPVGNNYYKINHTNKETDFVLSMEAQDYNEGYQMLDLRFEEVNSDPGPLLTCVVESFDALNHILFKAGVKKINSIFFTF